MIPSKYTFCMPDEEGHATASAKISLAIPWAKGPKGTQSYALIVSDTDSPKENRDKMNKEGMVVSSATARQTFSNECTMREEKEFSNKTSQNRTLGRSCSF